MAYSRTQKSFASFLCYFIISIKAKTQEISDEQLDKFINDGLRYSVKNRCLTQTIISNRHQHLLEHVVHARS